MDKGTSGYEDASSSQEREIQSGWPTRKLRAELKEAEQARKDEFAKEGKDMEARAKEAEVKEAKNRSAGERQARLKKREAGEATRQRRMGTMRGRRVTKKLRVRAVYTREKREGRRTEAGI